MTSKGYARRSSFHSEFTIVRKHSRRSGFASQQGYVPRNAGSNFLQPPQQLRIAAPFDAPAEEAGSCVLLAKREAGCTASVSALAELVVWICGPRLLFRPRSLQRAGLILQRHGSQSVWPAFLLSGFVVRHRRWHCEGGTRTHFADTTSAAGLCPACPTVPLGNSFGCWPPNEKPPGWTRSGSANLRIFCIFCLRSFCIYAMVILPKQSRFGNWTRRSP
ncbi:hypothetical protein MAMO4S_01530 [Mesorhizobium amorphae]